MTAFNSNRVEDWFIFAEIAHRMDDRLRLLKVPPESIIIMGSDGAQSLKKLRVRYPKIKILEVDSDQTRLNVSEAIAKKQQNFWQTLTPAKVQYRQQAFVKEISDKSFDMLWSNLSLQKIKDLPELFTAWSAQLGSGGMLFTSSLGTQTLLEIRTFLSNNNITLSPEPFFDMHDIGDLLAKHDFDDPIVDMDKITLTYQKSETFWQDMQLLGIWPLLQIPVEQQSLAQKLINRALAQQDLSTFTLEVIYAHAIKRKRQNDVHIMQFYSKKHL